MAARGSAQDATSSASIGIRKGEVVAMQTLLRDSELMRDPRQREKLFARILFYVAQGIDLSVIFSEMVINAATKDFIEKKLIFQYLIYYAPTESDLALLCVNTFRKDFQSEQPQIRGLALRSLSGLRVRSLLEYVVPCITNGLIDANSYVRANATMSALSLFYFAPDIFEEQKYLDTLFEMLRDTDPNVSGNCVCVLNEVLSTSKTKVLTKAMVVYLLKRLMGYNEWHIIAVLQLVKNYRPQTDDEMFDIMNLLEKYFRSTNSGIVFAVAEVFLTFTQNNPELHGDVCRRLVAPLVSLMSSPVPEITFTATKHAKAIQERFPGAFNKHFKSFFWRDGDPVYLQFAKLEMLQLVVCDANCVAVVNEINEYILDPMAGDQAIFCLGFIGVRVPTCFDELTKILQGILSLGEPKATRTVIVAIQDILRRYPEAYSKFIPMLGEHFYEFDSPNSKAALIYILGQFGEHIPAAPYLLERFVESVAPGATAEGEGAESSSSTTEPLTPPQISQLQLSLLTALTRLLFVRMAEVQPVLGRLLADIIADAPQGTLRDRALFVFRLLRDDFPLAREIFFDAPEKTKKAEQEKLNAQRQREKEKEIDKSWMPISARASHTGQAEETFSYAEDESDAVKEQVWREWGSFSVIHGHIAAFFTIGSSQKINLSKPAPPPPQPAPAAAVSPAALPAVAEPSGPQALPNQPIAAPQFQALWKTLPQRAVEELPITSPPTPEIFKAAMQKAQHTVVACGGKAGNIKMFVYSKTNTGDDLLAEISTNIATGQIICTVKTQHADFGSLFAMTLLGYLM